MEISQAGIYGHLNTREPISLELHNYMCFPEAR